ncbi:MAG: ATP-dependent helicase [Deltaproteobacteria bacterium]|nr:ATP-dependent helicase [Deltaproteobacteria bacterium]
MLDAAQKAFCQLPEGSVRLLAPAGCGKTQSLLWRCLSLAERAGKEKPKFLLFTFTRGAADELRDRLRNDTQFKILYPLTSITTLNAWGFRRLKASRHNLKLLTSSKDRFFCVNNMLQPVWSKYDRIKQNLTDSRRRSRTSHALMDLIDYLKTLGFRHDLLDSPKKLKDQLEWLNENGMRRHLETLFQRLSDLELLSSTGNPLDDIWQHFISFWREACDQLYASSVITLEDQKYWSWLEIEGELGKGRYLSGAARFHHIFVDEFQDINALDLGLLRAIAAYNKSSLTIVGDDDQAIYEWRGATPEFILNPAKHIGDKYTTCILAKNYRSPRNIVEVSQKLIAHNKRRVKKEVEPSSAKDAQISVLQLPNLTASVDFVVRLVRDLLSGNEVKNVAIIGRKRSQIIPYQIVFASQNIPFYAAEDLHVLLSDAFNELKEILAIQARATETKVFGNDPVLNLLRLCDKVKRFPLSKLDREALQRHLQPLRPQTLLDAVKALSHYTGPLKQGNTGGRMSESFAEAIANLLKAKTVSEAIRSLSDDFEGLQKDYGKSIEDIFYADPPFIYLAEYAQRYGTDYASFYEDIEKAVSTLARLLPVDDEVSADDGWKLPLHLMTALRAKGKEFDAVVILDANEDVWPSKLAKTDEELEQERRLFYVAFTRARKHLFILLNEKLIDQAAQPSRYLAEMGLAIGRMRKI